MRSTSSTSRDDSHLGSITGLPAVAGALVAEPDLVFTSNRGENTVAVFTPTGAARREDRRGHAAQRPGLGSRPRATAGGARRAIQPSPDRARSRSSNAGAEADRGPAGGRPHALGRLRSGRRRLSRQHRRSSADRRRSTPATRSAVRRVVYMPAPGRTGWTSTSRVAGCSAPATRRSCSSWMRTAARSSRGSPSPECPMWSSSMRR